MSIPPLVCSTPPPPDQCEDDKDPDEFDLQYSLSQEDDDENYDYGNFANYNHFQSSTSGNQKPDDTITATVVENVTSVGTAEGCIEVIEGSSDIGLGTNTPSGSKFKFDEDTNIEDLNLKVDEETIEKTDIIDSKDSSVTDNHKVDIVKEINFPSNSGTISQSNLNTCALPGDEYVIEPTTLDNTEEPPTYVDEIIEDETNDLQVDISETDILPETVAPFEETKGTIHPSSLTEEKSSAKETVEPSNLDSIVDDGFGDFEDFQFVSGDNKPRTIVDNCDNPWASKESDENDFGDFKANFDENENKFLTSSEIKPEHSKEESQSENQIGNNQVESDDDFGEFDDFKSSINESTGETERNAVVEDSLSCQHVPVLNLQSQDSESQVIESINKVLSTIFEQEISEIETEFEGKLESLLAETWGHLLETDVRQPYIVNWNNSLGQKTLLKALCIDSRNILFGPKWSYNMPKYAANLTAAPLQPQKQSTPSNVAQTENSSLDKNGTKTTGAWSDPFTSDGQESCNTDNGSENTVIEGRPTDLDVCGAAVTSKPEKIYSSTLNVQPLRQINLPDTHIFTPTDSETPRSKTIHYDSSPAVLLPKAVMEEKHPSENLAPQSSTSSVTNDLNNDNEYWEFQDFKGTSETLSPSSANQQTVESSESKTSQELPSPNITYGTQVLQPIRVEPIMPTLNWPDPGEVKETFDDFSDFVSNSSWSNEQAPTVTTPKQNSKPDNETENPSAIINNDIATGISNNSDSFDDEFDTFQSAMPPKSSHEFNTNHLSNQHNHTVSIPENPSPKTVSMKIAKFDTIFPKSDNKSDTISFPNTTRPNENLVHRPFGANNLENVQPPSIPMNTNILQPTAAGSSATSHNQQKSAQILQPLSLESYSQINWPNPGIDLQDLSRFNPVETLRSLKSDLSTNSHSKVASPAHSQKSGVNNQVSDDDIWGEFVSSKPKQQQALQKKSPTFVDDDEWTDFVSSPSVKPQNGLNTISLNVHTNLNTQKSSNQSKFTMKANQIPLDIPTLNYITPKSGTHKSYNDRHFQNL